MGRGVTDEIKYHLSLIGSTKIRNTDNTMYTGPNVEEHTLLYIVGGNVN